MHIPDGYLSPQTAAVMYAATLPFWIRASQKVRRVMAGRTAPLVALFAALAFVIMMFNVPLPGGTTGHAVGSTLAAIVLGPWVSVLAISIALIIQALFFGDGGILAIGANVFNMAVAMSFAGYLVYRALSGNSPAGSRRRVLAGAVAGYVAINLSALLTAIELGLQPLLFRDAAGHALYFPYSLDVSIPAMLFGHMTIAGPVEAAITGLVIAWLQRSNPQLLDAAGAAGSAGARISGLAWGAILFLVLLTPIGLLAPGTAWGEWGRGELERLGLRYIPAGFDRWSGIWSAPLSRYDLPLLQNPTLAYVFSAVIGVVLTVAAIWAVAWLLAALPGVQFGSRNRELPSKPDSPDEPLGRTVNSGRRHRPSRGFLEKTLSGISDTLEQSLFADEIARQPGMLQRLDPRSKLLAGLALLIAAGLARNPVVLVVLGLFGLALAVSAGIPLGYFFKRVWIAVLLFTGFIVFPSLFSPFTPGAPLITLIDRASPRIYLAITLPGVAGAVTLLLRVGASVSIAVLLVLATRWSALLQGLQVLRVPKAFILILGMTYRYIYLLLHMANDMFLARRSRLVGRVSGSEDRGWLSSSVGSLLTRTYDMSDEVYLAMQSRGFRGEVRTMDSLAWRTPDSLALLAAAAIALAVIWLGR